MHSLTRCHASVWHSSIQRHYPCKRPVVRDGYCAVHHPDAVAKRREGQRNRAEAKMRFLVDAPPDALALKPVHWRRWAVIGPDGEMRRVCLTEGDACETACGDEDVQEVAVYPVDAAPSVTREGVEAAIGELSYQIAEGEYEDIERAKRALLALYVAPLAQRILATYAAYQTLVAENARLHDALRDYANEELATHNTLAALRARVGAGEADTRRLDALERMANEPGGIHLHDGSVTGCNGLGLRPGSLVRSLREAIDAALPSATGPQQEGGK